MRSSVKIGFIGFGNMAKAMAEGFLKVKAVEPSQICACAKHWDKLQENAGRLGIRPCENAEDVARWSDIVIVAVKPYLVSEVLGPIREILKDKIVVSVAVGVLYDQYEDILLPGTSHLSTLPNTPVAIGEGIIICEQKHSLKDEEFETVKELLSSVALVESVDAKQMGIAGTISGCGPAFAAMFIEALSDAAVLHGLPRALSYQLASQMVAGTAKLQLATGNHPGAMKDAVCSPGGTTIVGVTTLERKGFRSAVIDAVDAVEKK